MSNDAIRNSNVLNLSWVVKGYFVGFFQKAEAQLAYELQAAKIQQKIRNEEIQIQVSFFHYHLPKICYE